MKNDCYSDQCSMSDEVTDEWFGKGTQFCKWCRHRQCIRAGMRPEGRLDLGFGLRTRIVSAVSGISEINRRRQSQAQLTDDVRAGTMGMEAPQSLDESLSALSS